jgi:hypothetical protein
MKRTIVMAIFAAAAALASTSATAHGQGKVTIPFNFHAGSATLPAGTYVVEYPMPKVISLRNRDGHESAFVLATTSTSLAAHPAKLVFARYGTQYFLRETLTAEGKGEMTFPPSTLESSIRAEEAKLESRDQILVSLK